MKFEYMIIIISLMLVGTVDGEHIAVASDDVDGIFHLDPLQNQMRSICYHAIHRTHDPFHTVDRMW